METSLDRLAMRARPEGSPVMHQNWENLLFLHWPIDPAAIRPLIPEGLHLDAFDGKAWIGITPFALTGLRVMSMPPFPGLDSFIELNVRTYVHSKGVPGVWFFSLDASKLIPVMAARMLFVLPYLKAHMEFTGNGSKFQFSSRRSDSPAARFRAHWQTGIRLRDPDLESLTFFLVERYCFFAGSGQNMKMTRVYHHPWILDEAVVLSHESTMMAALNIPEPTSPPVAHFSRSLNVEIWAPTAR